MLILLSKRLQKDNCQGSKVGLLAIAMKSDHRSDVGMESNLKGKSLLFLELKRRYINVVRARDADFSSRIRSGLLGAVRLALTRAFDPFSPSRQDTVVIRGTENNSDIMQPQNLIFPPAINSDKPILIQYEQRRRAGTPWRRS